jgi:hypothetical protein
MATGTAGEAEWHAGAGEEGEDRVLREHLAEEVEQNRISKDEEELDRQAGREGPSMQAAQPLQTLKQPKVAICLGL